MVSDMCIRYRCRYLEYSKYVLCRLGRHLGHRHESNSIKQFKLRLLKREIYVKEPCQPIALVVIDKQLSARQQFAKLLNVQHRCQNVFEDLVTVCLSMEKSRVFEAHSSQYSQVPHPQPEFIRSLPYSKCVTAHHGDLRRRFIKFHHTWSRKNYHMTVRSATLPSEFGSKSCNGT